jgi:hypothetical protein
VRVVFDVDEAGGLDVTAVIWVDVRVVNPDVRAGTIDVSWVDVRVVNPDVSAAGNPDVTAAT